MKKLYIIKAGTTFPATQKLFGDFDAWTLDTLGAVNLETDIIDAEHGHPLPKAGLCAGAVITGSHAMVTDNLPWSLALEAWITSLLRARSPLLGICYGHQLLARAAGGDVGFLPGGREIGTVELRLSATSGGDPLFKGLPRSFMVHATHAQAVLRLPDGAVPLAVSVHDQNQAFRLGECAWGVQFHPEYSAGIMRSYIQEQAREIEEAGMDIAALMNTVSETPFAARTLKNFARYAETHVNYERS